MKFRGKNQRTNGQKESHSIFIFCLLTFAREEKKAFVITSNEMFDQCKYVNTYLNTSILNRN